MKYHRISDCGDFEFPNVKEGNGSQLPQKILQSTPQIEVLRVRLMPSRQLELRGLLANTLLPATSDSRVWPHSFECAFRSSMSGRQLRARSTGDGNLTTTGTQAAAPCGRMGDLLPKYCPCAKPKMGFHFAACEGIGSVGLA